MKNLYIIYGCNKYWNRLRSSKKTWMNEMSSDEDYIILGEVNIPELKMAGFYSDNGQYLNLGMRTLMFLDHYSDYLKKWDWITFVDDDAYVFKKRLRKKLQREDSHRQGVVVGKSPGERVITMNKESVRFPLMHGGATISLNATAVKRVLDYLEENKDVLYDRKKVDPGFLSFGDVCVSYLCKKIRAKIINCSFEMSYLNHKLDRLKFSDYYQIITTHNVNDDDKKKLHKIDSK